MKEARNRAKEAVPSDVFKFEDPFMTATFDCF
jgi:hypothetical protein